MARIKKEELLMLVGALETINAKVDSDAEFDLEVYAWCQDQGVDLGEYLEGTYYDEADTTAVVSALEDYCEQIYQLSITEEKEARVEIAKKITKDLQQVREEIVNTIPADE